MGGSFDAAVGVEALNMAISKGRRTEHSVFLSLWAAGKAKRLVQPPCPARRLSMVGSSDTKLYSESASLQFR